MTKKANPTEKNSGQFIMIDNMLFNIDEQYFEKIGTEGFYIYCFLKYQKGQKVCAEVSIKMIQSFIAGEYDFGFKDTRSIKKYLEALIRNKFISIDEDKKIADIKINDIFDIYISDDCKSFTPVSCEMFKIEIRYIGCNGWALLCLLTFLFNKNYGSHTCEGFANPSQEYMSNLLNIHENTIKKYSDILEKNKLIKVKPQEPQKIIDKNGMEKDKYLPNHYIVRNRLLDQKYYIPFNTKKEIA